MLGISWLAAKPVSFSRGTLLHGVSIQCFPISETALFVWVFRIRVFAILLRAARRWRRVWSNGGMKLDEEKPMCLEKAFPSVSLSTTTLTLADPGSNPSLTGKPASVHRASDLNFETCFIHLSEYAGFHLSVSFHQCSVFIGLFFFRRTNGQTLEISKQSSHLTEVAVHWRE